MFNIRDEQLKTFAKQSEEGFVNRLTERLKVRLSERMPVKDDLLRRSVVGWIDDAQTLGLRRDQNIAKYVEHVALSQAYREDLETRLVTYLRLYIRASLTHAEAQRFVRNVLELAARVRIKQEEGVTWLAVILVHRCVTGDWKWVEDLLRQRNTNEEERVLRVHQEAVRLGWISSEGAPR